MNLGDLADVAEIVSAVGVILSLIYLAIQIRQNTTSVRAASFQELLNHVAMLNLRLVDDPVLAKLRVNALTQDFDAASPEGARWRAFSLVAINHWFHAYSQHREGTISDEQWKVLSGGVRRSVRTVQSTWVTTRENYPEDFRRYIDAEIESSRSVGGAA